MDMEKDGKFSTNKRYFIRRCKIEGRKKFIFLRLLVPNPTGDLGEAVEYSVTADFSNLSVNRRVNMVHK